jgi:hypothetical protein
MKSVDKTLSERVVDARGKHVVFLSHCLLDENVRCLGGAFHSGAVPGTQALIRSGVGICQLRCPEQRAWGVSTSHGCSVPMGFSKPASTDFAACCSHCS